MKSLLKYIVIGGVDVVVIYICWPFITDLFGPICDDIVLGVDRCRTIILAFCNAFYDLKSYCVKL